MLRCSSFLALLVILASAGSLQAGEIIDIETVFVGNPGNPDDTHLLAYGGVDHSYSIGKYEVTAGQYTEFLNAVAATDPHGLYNSPAMSSYIYGCKIERSGSSGSYTYSVAADWANRPVNYVSWGDAARFSNWLHNGQGSGGTETGSYDLSGAMSPADLMVVTRDPNATWVIPSKDEWYKAAYHKNDGATANYWDYPTGSDSLPSNDLVEPTDPGDNATFFDDGWTIGFPYFRTEVGAHENSGSPYGTFDLGGNVFEWNETAIGPSRHVHGGAFIGNNLHAATSFVNSPAAELFSLGFRVAQVPEPTTLSLLAFGSLALLRRRR